MAEPKTDIRNDLGRALQSMMSRNTSYATQLKFMQVLDEYIDARIAQALNPDLPRIVDNTPKDLL